MYEGKKIGTDSSNGVSFPNLEKLSEAYGLRYVRIANTESLAAGIAETLSYHEPVICEVMCEPDQVIAPFVGSRQLEDGTLISSPLEDMSPFLPREEFEREMIVPPVKAESEHE